MLSAVHITLKYYNSKLRHLFSISDKCTVGEVLGVEESNVVPFTSDRVHYSGDGTLDVNAILAGYGIQPGAGDMIGAFVGRECRGVGTMEEGTFSPLTVYCQKAGEPVALRYYSAAKGQIITFTTTFKPE